MSPSPVELLEWRRVHQAAVRPQGIEPAFNSKRGVDADVALENLAVVPDLLDDIIGELLVQSESFFRCLG